MKKVIVHIYNSTSTLQREVVFHKDREEIKDIAVIGTDVYKRQVIRSALQRDGQTLKN